MKKLLIALLAFSSLTFAEATCPQGVIKDTVKVLRSNKGSATLNYSSDQKTTAEACQAKLQQLASQHGKTATIELKEMPGDSKGQLQASKS